jgi:proline dehydrogenase
MPKKKQRQVVEKLSAAVMKKLRRSRALVAKELPTLIDKDQRLSDAMQEPTTSGALRRAIHSSKLLLPDLADRAQTDSDNLDAFLTGERPLTSDVIDRLAKILKLKLEAIGSK